MNSSDGRSPDREVVGAENYTTDGFNRRTLHTIVHIDSAFEIEGVDGILAAGDYDIDRDEELIDSASRPVWRRVATFLHLPARGMSRSTSQLVPITSAELEAVLRSDREGHK